MMMMMTATKLVDANKGAIYEDLLKFMNIPNSTATDLHNNNRSFSIVKHMHVA